jgi:hypothetical protein
MSPENPQSLYLIRRLYQRGYNREQINDLLEFIDWVLQLSSEDEIRLSEEIKTLEEVDKMPYVTSFERIGIQKGLLEDGREAVIEALDERFGDVPPPIAESVNQIADRTRLKFLLRYAIRCESLEEFETTLQQQNESA